MSESHKTVRLVMVRGDLEGVAVFPVPAGLAVRGFEAGDEREWLRIHAEAAPELVMDEAFFRTEFGRDREALAARQIFLCDGAGQEVGTVTAWTGEGFGDGMWGRIHWVAVMPAWQGRGVAHAMMTLACARLRELGHRRVYLVTDSGRWRAIRVYLRFGFVPYVEGEADRAAWAALPLSEKS